LDKKILGLIGAIIVVCSCVGAFVASTSITPPLQPTGEMDFTVVASSDCLRFLNSSVATVYVPFTVAANTNWQLSINCTKMAGGANGYTDVYVYNDYWNGGTNHTCTSSDLYPILSDIQSTDQQIRLGTPFTKTFGATVNPHSFTVFFVVPPGQQSTFHVTFKQV
jgi:hypothetical protein